jgi:hypothetical protein
MVPPPGGAAEMNVERSTRVLETPRGRVATLAFLSRDLSAPCFSEPLARCLHNLTGASVVLVRFADADNSTTLNTRLPGDGDFGDGFKLPSKLPQNKDVFHRVNMGTCCDLHPPDWIAAILNQLRLRFRYVLIEVVSAEWPAPSLFEFLLRPDLGYLFVRASNNDVYHLDLLIRELRPQLDATGVLLKPVFCLSENDLVDGCDALIRGVAGPVDVFIRGCPKSSDEIKALVARKPVENETAFDPMAAVV